MMRRLALAIALLLAAPAARAGDLGGSGIDFFGLSASVANTFTAAQTFSSTVDIIGNTTIGGSGGSKTLTLGSGSGTDAPQVYLNKGANDNAILGFNEGGASRAQIYLDSSENLAIRTTSNQPMNFGINAADKMRLDVSGQLNLGTTITNGQAALSISASNAMFAVVGSTATGSNALASIATTTPCGSNSVVGISFKICASNGTSCANYYLLACPQ